MDSIGSLLNSGRLALLILGTLLSGGCDNPATESWSGGDLRGVNHTRQEIPRFSVNGRTGPNIGAFGEGGGHAAFPCLINGDPVYRPTLSGWSVPLLA